MNLYNRLATDDIDKLHSWIDAYIDCGCSAIDKDKMEYFLRFWAKEKMPLFKMFGEEFILEKSIRFDKPEEVLKDEIYFITRHFHNGFLKDASNLFCYEFDQYITERFSGDHEEIFLRNKINDFAFNYEDLMNNIYSGDTFVIPAKYTIDRKDLQIPHGSKVVKMIGKVAKAFGIDKNFEAFRQAHSQVLNQKRVSGTLCLSIHPLDYLTMSDNSCGWESCMSWVEGGDYRLGTIEMMNSPCVVVAYVKSSEDMYVPGGHNWNSKKWRQLYLITPEMILGNRQYPYDSDDIQGAAIKWLRELASVAPGYGPYPEETCLIRNQCTNTFDGDKHIHINIQSNYMYNDVYDNRLAYFAADSITSNYYLNFSGLPVCAHCGDVIELGCVEPCYVCCNECNGNWCCDCCGDWYCDTEPIYINDSRYCPWCYEHELDVCSLCEERTNDTCYLSIRTNLGKNDPVNARKYADFNGKFAIKMCYDCYSSPEGRNLGEFGIMHRDDYNYPYVLLEEMSDFGLTYLPITSYVEKNLQGFKNAETDAERLEFLQKLIF